MLGQIAGSLRRGLEIKLVLDMPILLILIGNGKVVQIQFYFNHTGLNNEILPINKSFR